MTEKSNSEIEESRVDYEKRQNQTQFVRIKALHLYSAHTCSNAQAVFNWLDLPHGVETYLISDCVLFSA